MTIIRIDASRIAQVEQLWQRSRHLYQNIAHEDLPLLLSKQIALLSEDKEGQAWRFLCLQSEKRPTTLPVNAPNRAYIRAVALARGYSPTTDIPPLLAAAEAHLSAYAPAHLVTVYGDHNWLNRALSDADFTVAEEVQFLALDRLQRWQPPRLISERVAQLTTVQIRPAHPDDLAILAHLDARAFSPLWHFGVDGLRDLLFTGRLHVATVDDNLVGYTAIASHDGSAHLARLAVHPQWQGHGFGQALLLDVLLDAQREGIHTVMLNTQVHNTRAEQLYRSYGFRPTNLVIPVLAKLVGVDTGQDLHRLIMGPVA